MSNRTIPVVVLMMNPRIYQKIGPIVVAPQMLLTPAMKELVADAASGGVWVNRTLWKVSRDDVDRSTPGNIVYAVRVEYGPSPFLIVIVSTYPPCSLNGILQVANKRQYTSPGLDMNTQKLDNITRKVHPKAQL